MPSRAVHLNVGGELFDTTEGTLQKDTESMLAKMFSGDFEAATLDKDGRYV